ncbi:MAG: aminotransferase class I/II-fold pyridoxal phosphate-dependent enzyme [Candidatus Izemoplasmatales bacterium]|jgi:aspartate/tyrosine/aromatic aminotransferase|nr:aminotransferase class I/II-fold pyridoxal phosphate-dependent enzyme [Candidatus Izemoplasmatales bacterium]
MHSNIVGRHAESKKLQSNILQISQEAKAMKAKYGDVIDATVGMLHHEKGNVFKYHVVEELLHKLSDAEIYHYAPVRGTKAFSEGAFNWVFGKHSDLFKEKFHYSVIPTTGGSGAISNTFFNFNDFGQKVLLPNHYWTPYENFAFEAGVDLKTFKMYDENNHFNLADFKEKARELAKEQERLCVLLNDPCNNPTGLCMTEEDWKEVVATLNEISRTNIPVILIQDIAYIDYQEKDTEVSRDAFLSLLDLDPDILAVVIFSGSKTFSLYGFRIGAQIGLSKSQDIIDHFIRVGDYSVRGRFSSVSQPGMNIIGKIFTDKEYLAKFQDELVEARKLLKERGSLFVSEAGKQGLKMLPYLGGFFISIETANKNIFQDLVNEHVFVIPMEGLIRIAVSSLNREEIPRLVSILKKHV